MPSHFLLPENLSEFSGLSSYSEMKIDQLRSAPYIPIGRAVSAPVYQLVITYVPARNFNHQAIKNGLRVIQS